MKTRSQLFSAFSLLALASVPATADTLFIGDEYPGAYSYGFVLKVNASGQTSTYSPFFNIPYAMAFNASGNLFVGTESGLYKCAADGTPTLFDAVRAQGLAFDPQGNLYMSDPGDSRDIFRYAPDGTKTVFATETAGTYTYTLAYHNGILYGLDRATGKILEFDANGNETVLASGLTGPGGLAFDSAGDVVTAQNFYNGSVVDKISPQGTITPFVSTGLTLSLAIDSQGELYLGNTYNNGNDLYINRYTATGVADGTLYEQLGGGYAYSMIFESDASPGESAVPEPGSVALLLSPLVALGGITARKRIAQRKRRI